MYLLRVDFPNDWSGGYNRMTDVIMFFLLWIAFMFIFWLGHYIGKRKKEEVKE